MFAGLQSDRPFCLLILVISDLAFDTSIVPKFNEDGTYLFHKDPLAASTILVLKGIPDCHPNSIMALLKIASIDTSYWYIDPLYLKQCDRMYDHIKEVPSQQ